MKYIKKSPVVEAFQYDGDLMNSDGNYYVPEWAVKAFETGVLYYDGEPPCYLYVHTLHSGDVKVEVGSYIVLSENGDLFIRHPAIFEKYYIAINEEKGATMTNYERIRNQTVEEVAKDRVFLEENPADYEYGVEASYWYHGDFGSIISVKIRPLSEEEKMLNDDCLDSLKETLLNNAVEAAKSEALRLEMEWLKSEVTP